MLISDIIFKVLLHKEESLMRICAKSLYPAPLFGYRNYGKTSAGRNSSRFDTCENY